MKLKPFSLRLRPWQWGAAAALLLAIVIGMSFVLPQAVDFHNCYRPAAIGILHGQSPYTVACYFNVPWAALPFIPIVLLPENLGRALLFVCAMLAYTFVAFRLGGKPLSIVFFLLSPTVIHDLLNGNLDWLVMLGFVLPRPVGIFFLAVKPQLGFALAIFWLIEDWRDGGWRKVFRNYWPVAVTTALSFVFFGMWPLKFGVGIGATWEANASLWPMSIPIGLALMVAAVRQRNGKLAIAASPCFSPYLKFHSWSASL